jgi:hypothetical protein
MASNAAHAPGTEIRFIFIGMTPYFWLTWLGGLNNSSAMD